MATATLAADPDLVHARINPHLYGSFVEHLGRCVYGGIFEPDHPTADDHGFRTDVLALVRELGVTTVRYPGGNFVSGYRWEDGVGPLDARPRRRDLAWHSIETNEVGLDEFMEWSRLAGTEPMMAVNLGTRGTSEALDLLEYANLPTGTTLSDARAANGHPDPYGVRMWCLGNEMDGPWQLGHRSAEDYATLATRTGAAMLQMDPSLDLVVCGSSFSAMPTFGSWERTVLESAWDVVSHISCHAYYEKHDGDTQTFLASAVDMDRFIEAVAATIDHVAAVKHSDKKIGISFDEWNVWYQTHFEEHERVSGALDPWPVAPHLLEDVYTLTDAIVVGNLLISLLRHADRVSAASLAQLVNVIAPIRTEPGGPAWRQTIFHPFALTSALARGEVLECSVDGPQLATGGFGMVSALDAVATLDRHAGRGAVLAVNRSLDEAIDLRIDPRLLAGAHVTRVRLLADTDHSAVNTAADPRRIEPREVIARPGADGSVTVALPAVSWAAIEFTR